MLSSDLRTIIYSENVVSGEKFTSPTSSSSSSPFSHQDPITEDDKNHTRLPGFSDVNRTVDQGDARSARVKLDEFRQKTKIIELKEEGHEVIKVALDRCVHAKNSWIKKLKGKFSSLKPEEIWSNPVTNPVLEKCNRIFKEISTFKAQSAADFENVEELEKTIKLFEAQIHELQEEICDFFKNMFHEQLEILRKRKLEAIEKEEKKRTKEAKAAFEAKCNKIDQALNQLKSSIAKEEEKKILEEMLRKNMEGLIPIQSKFSQALEQSGRREEDVASQFLFELKKALDIILTDIDIFLKEESSEDYEILLERVKDIQEQVKKSLDILEKGELFEQERRYIESSLEDWEKEVSLMLQEITIIKKEFPEREEKDSFTPIVNVFEEKLKEFCCLKKSLEACINGQTPQQSGEGDSLWKQYQRVKENWENLQSRSEILNKEKEEIEAPFRNLEQKIVLAHLILKKRKTIPESSGLDVLFGAFWRPKKEVQQLEENLESNLKVLLKDLHQFYNKVSEVRDNCSEDPKVSAEVVKKFLQSELQTLQEKSSKFGWISIASEWNDIDETSQALIGTARQMLKEVNKRFDLSQENSRFKEIEIDIRKNVESIEKARERFKRRALKLTLSGKNLINQEKEKLESAIESLKTSLKAIDLNQTEAEREEVTLIDTLVGVFTIITLMFPYELSVT